MPLYVYNTKNRSKQQSSDKSLLNTLSVAELKRVFGNSGEFASLYARVFVVSSKAYYYLSRYDVNVDAINVANWLPVPSAKSVVEMYESISYNRGSFVLYNNMGNLELYIATQNIASNEVPSISAKWQKINTSVASSGQVSAIRQTEKITVDDTHRTFSIEANADITINHSRIPTIQVMFEKSDGTFEIAYPEIIITKHTKIVFNIQFLGDLSELKQSNNNVTITLL